MAGFPNQNGPATSRQVMAELSLVSKSYGRRKVIDQASLRIFGDRVLFLVGPSGIGKSTLLEILVGLVRPDSGQVKLSAPPSMLFQDNLLIPWLDALSNLTYIMPREMEPGVARELASHWLKTFGLEPEKFPQAMSGGMRRRLALARAMAAGRSLLILDEPFAFLDGHWHEVITDLVAGQISQGAAVVIAGHSLPSELAARLVGRLDLAEVMTQPIRLDFPPTKA